MTLEGIDGQSLAASVAILSLTDEKRASSAKRPSCDLPECFNDVNAKTLLIALPLPRRLSPIRKPGRREDHFVLQHT
jgi:hypothetical protein